MFTAAFSMGGWCGKATSAVRDIHPCAREKSTEIFISEWQESANTAK